MTSPHLDDPGDGLGPGALRERVWGALMRGHAAAYPLPVRGHHPNFRGAAEAADPLVELLLADGAVRSGDAVLAFPDYVLKPVRKRLLEAGVHVVVPGKYRGYRLLRSGVVAPASASSIAGAERLGLPLDAPPPVRLALVACVALDPRGARLSKGYGFRLPDDGPALPSATIVHPLQLVPRVEPPEGRVRYYALPGEARRA